MQRSAPLHQEYIIVTRCIEEGKTLPTSYRSNSGSSIVSDLRVANRSSPPGVSVKNMRRLSSLSMRRLMSRWRSVEAMTFEVLECVNPKASATSPAVICVHSESAHSSIASLRLRP